MQPLVEYISIHCHDNGTVGNLYTVKQLLIQQCEGRSNKWRLCSVAVLDFGEEKKLEFKVSHSVVLCKVADQQRPVPKVALGQMM